MARGHLSSTVVAVMLCLCLGGESRGEDAAVRQVPIPQQEHGYGNFETTVLHSQKQFDDFLKGVASQQGWNGRDKFEKAMAAAKIDFAKETLVLLRHTEGSGSIQVALVPPAVKGKKLTVEIKRKEPEVGTADMAYYCFALVVPKNVEELEVKPQGKPAASVSLAEMKK